MRQAKGGQLELAIKPVYKWGGKRPGAGRKKGARPPVAHQTRPFHERVHPVHVTWRLVPGLPSARELVPAGIIGRTIRQTTWSHARRRTGFRIIHFSIQSHHLHLIVEARNKTVLTAGLRGLAVWLARRLNQELDRQGQVFAERYHARPLTSPTQVRNAIVYVLQNHRHHSPSRFLVDECSSAAWFTGWERPLPPPPTPSPVSVPATWLARRGWRKKGLLRFDEAPKS